MAFCNCNHILFTKLPWPRDSEGTFRSSSQAATCPPVYHTQWRLHTVPLIAERQAGKLWIPIFIVFGLTGPGIEPKSTDSVADALSTRPPIGIYHFFQHNTSNINSVGFEIQSNFDTMPPFGTERKWHSSEGGIVTRICKNSLVM